MRGEGEDGRFAVVSVVVSFDCDCGDQFDVRGGGKAGESVMSVLGADGAVTAVVQNGQEGIALRGENSDGELAVGGSRECFKDCGDDPVTDGNCSLVHAVVVEQDDVDSTRAG